jgi:hypothetical protein
VIRSLKTSPKVSTSIPCKYRRQYLVRYQRRYLKAQIPHSDTTAKVSPLILLSRCYPSREDRATGEARARSTTRQQTGHAARAPVGRAESRDPSRAKGRRNRGLMANSARAALAGGFRLNLSTVCNLPMPSGSWIDLFCPRQEPCKSRVASKQPEGTGKITGELAANNREML